MRGIESWVYSERLTSWRTQILFAGLALLFLLLAWLAQGATRVVCLVLAAVFVFYTLNYIRLVIRIDQHALQLTFGLFSWTVPLDNVDSCRMDDVPPFLKYGGAGIHYMTVRGRYRVSFNFLEYPRVVIALKRPAGLVKDVSFSSRRPSEVIDTIRVEGASV